MPEEEVSGYWFQTQIILVAVQVMQNEGRKGRFPPAWAVPLLSLVGLGWDTGSM